MQNDRLCSVGLQEAMELIPGKYTFVLGDILQLTLDYSIKISLNEYYLWKRPHHLIKDAC